MLKINLADKHRTCDGVTRRGFIQLGAFGFAGLTLANLYEAEAAAGIKNSHKALINIHLGGGPSHQDIYDLKPNAPVEFRGEFNPIATNVPGMQICEHLPKLAKMADKFAVVRSLVGSNAGHSNYQTHTGYNQRSLTNIGGRPSIGSVVAKLQGSRPGAPPFVSYNGGSPGYLGPVYSPFSPREAQKVLRMDRSMTVDRLSGRTNLLTSLDGIRRDLDSSGKMEALDSYTQQAYDMVTSGKVADAMDLGTEDPEIVKEYGRTNSNLLIARRLIQCGVRVITMNGSWGGWDTHSNNFTNLKKRNLPTMDHGLSTLLTDLERNDMLQDVTIVVWGEFGRTPRVNARGGRDHWPRLSHAFLAGGGLKTGQMVGTSTKYAEYAQDRPVDYQEVHATLYHTLGIDPRTAQIIDPNGRPQYLLDMREPVAELV
jgi:hypothetical protein